MIGMRVKVILIFLGILLIIGLLFLQQFKDVIASTFLIPRNTPLSTPTNPGYPPPGIELMPGSETAYPPPTVFNGEITKISPTITPEFPFVSITDTPVILVNGWYLYNDSEGGFSITYPPDAYISSSKSRSLSIFFHLSDVNGSQGMQIVIFPNPDNLPLVEVIISQIFPNNPRYSTVEDIESAMTTTNIAGITFFTLKDPVFDTIELLSLDKKVYFISPMPDMMMGNPPDPQSVQLFFSILETIKITNTP